VSEGVAASGGAAAAAAWSWVRARIAHLAEALEVVLEPASELPLRVGHLRHHLGREHALGRRLQRTSDRRLGLRLLAGHRLGLALPHSGVVPLLALVELAPHAQVRQVELLARRRNESRRCGRWALDEPLLRPVQEEVGLALLLERSFARRLIQVRLLRLSERKLTRSQHLTDLRLTQSPFGQTRADLVETAWAGARVDEVARGRAARGRAARGRAAWAEEASRLRVPPNRVA
jgi:hypothetical protein